MRIFVASLLIVVFGALMVGCPIENDPKADTSYYTRSDDGVVGTADAEDVGAKEDGLLAPPSLKQVSEVQTCIDRDSNDRCLGYNSAAYYVDEQTKICYLIYRMQYRRSGMAPTDCASIGIEFDDDDNSGDKGNTKN